MGVGPRLSQWNRLPHGILGKRVYFGLPLSRCTLLALEILTALHRHTQNVLLLCRDEILNKY